MHKMLHINDLLIFIVTPLTTVLKRKCLFHPGSAWALSGELAASPGCREVWQSGVVQHGQRREQQQVQIGTHISLEAVRR